MSARLAIVSGCDLAQLVRAHYPRWLNYTIYGMMEIAVIGSDIQVAYMTIYIHIHIHMSYP